MTPRIFSIFRIVLWLGIFGLTLYLLGLMGGLKLYQSTSILIVIGYLSYKDSAYLVKEAYKAFRAGGDWWLKVLVGGQWLTYSWGLMVPEVSFDAVWYHLPMAQVYASTGIVWQIPELLYSTMPRLGELYFSLGFLAHSPTVVKGVSFGVALLYLLLGAIFARLLLPRLWSWLAVLTIGSMGVVAWQSTAGYVDLLRGVFEMAAVLSLYQFITCIEIKEVGLKEGDDWYVKALRFVGLAGVFTGLALGVKMQAVAGLFAGGLALWFLPLKISGKRRLLAIVGFVITTLFVASPWYIDNYFQTGNAFYPINTLGVVSGKYNYMNDLGPLSWLGQQLLRLPWILWEMIFAGSGILTPMLLVLAPIWGWQLLKQTRIVIFLTVYAIVFLGVWWFTPPPESRFLLGIMPVLLVLLYRSVSALSDNYRLLKIVSILMIVASAVLHLGIREIVLYRNLPVIIGFESREYYVARKTSEFNRAVMEAYYSGYWSDYTY